MAKPLDNDMRRFILKKLSLKPSLSFSQLFDNKFYSSSQFAYHVKWLLDKSYITKKNDLYCLDKLGKQLVNYISLGKFEKTKQPLIVLAVILKDKNKILISSSKKEPLANYWGLSCFGKYKSDNILEELKLLCKEKTGYDVSNFKFGGVFNIKTSDVDLNHQLLVFTSETFTGNLIEETEFRVNRWATKPQRKNLTQFPENEFIVENCSKSFFDLERSIDEDSFKVLLKLI